MCSKAVQESQVTISVVSLFSTTLTHGYCGYHNDGGREDGKILTLHAQRG
jgi:hypothetical protein